MTLLLDTVTVRSASLADRFSLAASAGYAGLELWGDELDEHPDGVAGIRALSSRFRLPVVGFCPHRSLYEWHHRWDAGLQAAFEQQIARYAEVGGSYLVLPVLSEEGGLEDTAKNLRRIIRIAGHFGMTAALEPIGHVRKLARIADAIQILEASPGAELVLDAFHYFRGRNRLEELQHVDVGRIAVVHLDDAIALPLDRLLGFKHRVYPGQGIFDVLGLCAALRRMRYAGRYAVELLNPDYWAADPAIVCKEAWRTSTSLLDIAERRANDH